LKDLKMGEARFLVELTSKENPTDWTGASADQIQFVVQTNRGEPARPIGKIASGGELSRLMLAIRRVISDKGGIGVYLFDEIDAGIGGQTAFQVGKKLKSVASYNQVICITHLPQVASFADHHLIVRKSVQGQRTQTEVKNLTPLERKEELARMLGGPELTQRSLENASELLELASKP
jgi:DNA repair protein RecN (Recombination protein N)